MININKSQVLSIADFSPYKTVRETKLTGIFFTIPKKERIEIFFSS